MYSTLRFEWLKWIQKLRAIPWEFWDEVFSLSMPSVCPHLTTVQLKSKTIARQNLVKTNHCDLCFHYNKTMTVMMSKVSQLILHILHTSLIATIVFFYHHLKYCFCKCYSYPCFYFLTLWVRNASCFAGNVTGWNIGQEFQTRVGNSSVNPFTWTRVGA